MHDHDPELAHARQQARDRWHPEAEARRLDDGTVAVAIPWRHRDTGELVRPFNGERT